MLFLSLNDLTHQLILGHVKTNALITSKYPIKHFELCYSILLTSISQNFICFLCNKVLLFLFLS